MKRVAAALVMLGVGTAFAAPAGAATLGGSAHLTWTVGAVTSVALITDYTAAPLQGTASPTFGSSGTGTCGAPTGEVANTLTFGTITPPTANYQGCNYPNAIAIGVQSNDANGYKVYEYMNAIPAAGTQICAFQNDTAMAATPTASKYTGASIPAAYGAACATGGFASGNLLTVQGGATSGAGYGAPGTGAFGTANANPTYSNYTGGTAIVSTATTSPSMQWAGQDVQLNISSAAASGAVTTSEIIFTVLPN